MATPICSFRRRGLAFGPREAMSGTPLRQRVGTRGILAAGSVGRRGGEAGAGGIEKVEAQVRRDQDGDRVLILGWRLNAVVDRGRLRRLPIGVCA
ncbi:hypothetical protein [Paraburkholderia dipogonis]|uniref:hypothetical protein n=1 Tax=Paraburkholderia dipogonis TaxID=1211383 RepID=UPI00366D17F6